MECKQKLVGGGPSEELFPFVCVGSPGGFDRGFPAQDTGDRLIARPSATERGGYREFARARSAERGGNWLIARSGATERTEPLTLLLHSARPGDREAVKTRVSRPYG